MNIEGEEGTDDDIVEGPDNAPIFRREQTVWGSVVSFERMGSQVTASSVRTQTLVFYDIQSLQSSPQCNTFPGHSPDISRLGIASDQPCCDGVSFLYFGVRTRTGHSFKAYAKRIALRSETLIRSFNRMGRLLAESSQ